MKKKRAAKGVKRALYSFVVFTLGVFMLNMIPSNYVAADQTGFEVGKTWGENQKELEKTYKKSKTVSKNKESKGGVQLKIKEYPLSHYEAVANTSGISAGNDSLLNIANGIFGVNKLLVQGFDTGIQLLQGTDFMDSQLNTVGGYTKTIYTQLLDSLLSIMVIILLFFLLYAATVQQSIQTVFKQLFGFVFVLSLGTIFIMNGPEVLKKVNEASVEFEEVIISSGTTITGAYEMSEGDTSKDSVTSMMRNKMFDVGVLRPYLLMNYGTTDINEIEGGQKQIDKLLKYAQNVTGKASKKEEVKKQAKENVFMDKDGVGITPKIGYALFSVFSTYSIGTVILLISSIGFISQLFVTGAFFILVISIFVSLIPKFQDSWVKPLSGIIGAIFLKGLSIFFIMLIYVIIRAVDVAITPNTVGKYICNVVLLAFVLNWIKNNRGQIVSAIVNKDGSGGMNALINGGGGTDPARQAKKFGRNRMAEYMMMSRILRTGGRGRRQENDRENSGTNGNNPTRKVRAPANRKPSNKRNNSNGNNKQNGKNGQNGGNQNRKYQQNKKSPEANPRNGKAPKNAPQGNGGNNPSKKRNGGQGGHGNPPRNVNPGTSSKKTSKARNTPNDKTNPQDPANKNRKSGSQSNARKIGGLKNTNPPRSNSSTKNSPSSRRTKGGKSSGSRKG